ncbi:MAG: HAMP domain-containing sensor histidine kinase [Candidatus Moraniibacteriota bacterium]
MKNIFSRAVSFIKENPSVTYSLVLVFLIPVAFFINTYLINSSYEADINKITQKKAVLVEEIINKSFSDSLDNATKIQAIIDEIATEDSEIVEITVNKPAEEGRFAVVASNQRDLVGTEQENELKQNVLAWNTQEGIAFLDQKDGERFWRVTKAIYGNGDEKIGLMSISLSLAGTDNLINKTIYRSYWVLFLTIVVVLLFVSNQAKLFGYALTVTKLKELDKMKDMFISMASHELRSPLGAIKGYLDFLKEKKEVLADEEARQYVGNITTSVDRLNGLVSDMLEVSRLEGNRMPMKIESADVNKIIGESIEEIRSQAVQKGLALNFNPVENTLFVLADGNRLKQVLINLIGNSIKYTPQGSITVSTGLKDKELGITIADTGIGISSEDQADLFGKFHRIQNDKTKNITGTGLGLWITMEIVKRMKGRIAVESIEGVGSHFTVYLPVVKG